MVDAAVDEAQTLLRVLAASTGDDSWSQLETAVLSRIEPRDDADRWTAGGAMTLTGPRDGEPCVPAAPIASRLVGAGAVLAEVSRRTGVEVYVDPVALLGERAALRGLRRDGARSAGGSCRLLPARDGWVAVSLARPDDWELLPAAFGCDVRSWDDVAAAVAQTSADALVTVATDLGLAVGAFPAERGPTDEQWRFRQQSMRGPWVIATPTDRQEAPRRAPLRVVDLSALWAGPLCASLLHRAGAEVVTVESAGRPDGARRGDPELHRLLHDGHALRTLDFTDSSGVAELHGLVATADVVVTAARPRALHGLGLDPPLAIARHPGLTWIAITAYGFTGPWSNRIGYGDDTAVAGGLAVRDPAPMFCGDAIADPSTGVYAAIAALAVAHAGGGLVDVALRDVAAHLARP